MVGSGSVHEYEQRGDSRREIHRVVRSGDELANQGVMFVLLADLARFGRLSTLDAKSRILARAAEPRDERRDVTATGGVSGGPSVQCFLCQLGAAVAVLLAVME